jgi:hypothetical protein
LIKDRADRGGISLGDYEHPKSMTMCPSIDKPDALPAGRSLVLSPFKTLYRVSRQTRETGGMQRMSVDDES